MKGFLYIDDTIIGEAEFQIIDESMGAIGGNLITYEAYETYGNKIQELFESKGIANIDDFHFQIIIDGKTINNAGGIGVIDAKEFGERYVESAGIDLETFGFS